MEAMTGMIFTVPFSWAPQGWLTCNGQVLSVQQYQALFSLISNLYGGNIAQGTFGLPNFQGRTAIGMGQSTTGSTQYALASVYGTETTTLTSANLPPHAHPATFTPTTGSQNINIPAQPGTLKVAINVASTAAGNAGPSNTAIPAASAGANTKIYTSTTASPAPTTTALADTATAVTGNAPTAQQTVSVNTVTGGTVAVGPFGGGAAYTNLQPSLALNFIITMFGLYPSRP